MANSIVTFASIGAPQSSFSFSFSYLAATDIDAFVDGTSVFANNASTGTAVGGNTYTVAFSSSGSKTLTFSPAVPQGSTVRIERNTALTSKAVDFSDGAVLTELALDSAIDQVFFATQESNDKTAESIAVTPDGKFDAQTRVIKNVATPTNANDATNKSYVDTSANNAASSAAAALVSQNAAASSAAAALASQNAAASSQSSTAADVTATNADVVVTNADVVSTNADAASTASDRTAAASSASSASTSAATATTKASDSSTSAAASLASQNAAATSSAAALASQNAAATSQTASATSESNASTSETNSATSATQSANSATDSANSASAASTSESNAATSAATATTQAALATTNGAAQVLLATTQANNAAVSATNSANSATASANSASAASTSETNAASSASSASSAQTAAESARDATLAAYDNFDDRYLGTKSTAPTVDNDGNALVAGALYFDSVAGAMYVYTGSAWVAAYVSGTGFLALTGGTMSGDINFGDNDKAIFGAGGDLSVYHDGTQSIIADTGAGQLSIRGENTIAFTNAAGTETYASMVKDGAVTLKHNNESKFATSSTGANITGVLTSDGLTVDGGTITAGASGTSGQIDAPESFVINIDSDNNSTTRAFVIKNNGSAEIARFTEDGRLGLGVSSPTADLHISYGSGSGLLIEDTTNSPSVKSVITSGNTESYFGATSNHPVVFLQNNTERMRISSGNVGIGTASPSAKLELNNGGAGSLVTFTDGVSTNFNFSTSGTVGYFGTDAGGTSLALKTTGAERMRIDASGMVLIGQSASTIPGIGNTTAGIALRAEGVGAFSVNDNPVAYFNRNTSDGTSIQFHRQGNPVGYISVTTTGTTYNTTSDIRLKTDIEPLVATDKLMAMNPVSYAWKVDPDGPRSMGFIAQEMQEVMPEAISTGDDDDAMMSMDYGRITPILVSALQDAHRKIEDLESRIAAMESSNE